MRCPKCHYITFGSAERCRNCGYELLLAVQPPPLDLPIQDQPAGPLEDFVLSDRGPAAAVVAVPESTSLDENTAPRVASRFELPLFPGSAINDAPLVTPPAVPRSPLSVRRGQPAVARPRQQPALLTEEPESAPNRVVRLETGRPIETAAAPDVARAALEPRALESASVFSRALAGLVDVLILGAIDAAILYFTLRVADLPFADVWSLPPVPFGVFLLLLNGGYLAIFTAAGGQTIGKMLAGIRVVADCPADDLESDHVRLRISLGASVLRATAYLASLLPAGLGFAAILFDPEGHALHDRLAGTRVVKA
jgi:uncharacterized RDD family membrane protein YckC